MKRTVVHYFLSILALSTLAGCDDGTNVSDTARIRVLLTDAPSDYIASAMVDIGSVELLPAGGGDRVVLTDDGTDGEVDLLDLQGLTTELLADIEIPSDTYVQMRLIVESASVVLAEGYEFNSGGNTDALNVPSGAQTGIKLNLREDEEGDEESAGVRIAGGETVLVVDFDVHQSFRIQGSPDTPAGINGVSFRPTLRVVVEDVAGSISGTLSTSITDQSLEDLVVTAETVDPGVDEEFQSSKATGVSEASGTYTIFFLAPGSYNVTVGTPDGVTSSPPSTEVTVGESEDVTGVDFELVPVSG